MGFNSGFKGLNQHSASTFRSKMPHSTADPLVRDFSYRGFAWRRKNCAVLVYWDVFLRIILRGVYVYYTRRRIWAL